MKIMLQNHTFYPVLGGIENYLYHVSKVLQKMGHQPIILCEKHQENLSSFGEYDGISIVRHPYYRVSRPFLFMKPKLISGELRDFISIYVGDVDLVISRYPHYCYATCLLGLKIPVFYIPGTLYWRYLKRSSENSSLKGRLFNFIWKPIFDDMESKCISMSNKVITLSRYISSSLAEYYGFGPEKFIVNPPGVDLYRFRKQIGTAKIRRDLDIPKNEVILLYLGRLSVEKNVERLIEELKKMGRKNVKLLIVGCGSERLKLEQLRNELGMIDKIIFMGLRKDVERFYAAADIFVLPSKYEGFGQVILEAMAAGLPCIAFKRMLPEYEVATEEIIQHGVTGFCVDPYNKSEYQERLKYLIDHPDVRKKMGETGRELCERKFTWEGHVKRLLDLACN